jgi:CHAT domain-containing protein/tetratricopeptide (TPR) repeat protein
MPASALTTPEPPIDLPAWIVKLADVESEQGRREFFFSTPAAHQPSLAQQLHAEVLRLAYVDLDRAGRLSQAAEWLSEILDDDGARALAVRSRGHVNFARGQHSEALECYETTIQLLERCGDDLNIGRTLSSGLQPLIYLGEYDRALEWADRARVIFERHSDELRLARLSSNIGNILFRQDRHAEALQYYQAAQEPLSRIGESRDVAAVLSNMAVCCTSMGRFAEARAHYQAAREHCVRHNLPLLVAAADYNIAYLHYLRGDYVGAMQLYQVSRADAEQAGDFYHAALCDLDESEMYLELNLTEEATQLAQNAAARFHTSGMNYERAKAIVNQAMAASQNDDPGRAIRLLREARQLFEKEQNQVWPALIDLYQAILRYQQGRFPEARRLSRKAANFLSGSLLAAKAALCQLLQAQLLWKEGKPAPARAACRQVLENLDPDAAPSLRFHVNFVLGQVEETLTNWDEAWTAYQNARQAIETLRRRLWGDELKISILKDKLAVYEALVWLSLWRRTPGEPANEEAFLLIEQAKSRNLADRLGFAWVAPSKSTREIENRVLEIRRDLNWHYRQIEISTVLAQSGLPAQVDTLRKQARAHEERLVRGLSELRAAGSGPSLVDASLPVSLEQIQSSIAPDAMLLEYYEVRGVFYVCLVARDRLQMVPLAAAAKVRERLLLLQFQLDKFRLGGNYQRAFWEAMLSATQAHLEELHGMLIEPLRPFLRAQHLIIAPHGFLHNLPFHALRAKEHYLADQFSISYAPSASVYSLCSGREASFANQSLVMGIPDTAAPVIETEARQAAAALPNARLLIGTEATEAALRAHGPSSRFIHIATHGLFRRDNPMFSAIRLGDSDLSLFDLYQIPLSSELVTLSGCSTGRNVVLGGDELVGLMRGLFYAGAQGILVSLWDVHDRSTAEFMTGFYSGLQSHPNKADALRAAMCELRREYPHPYYWAPFILVGKYAS